MTDAATPSIRLRRNTVVLAISNVGTALLSFLLAALIARALGEQGLGAYAVALAWVLPLALLAEFGIGTYLTRVLSRNDAVFAGEVQSATYSVQNADLKSSIESIEPETPNTALCTLHTAPKSDYALLSSAIAARLLMGGGAMLLLMLAAPLLANDLLIVRGIQISAPLVLIQPLYSTYTAVFRARGDMRPIPWLNIGMLVAQVVLTWGVLTLTPRPPLPQGEGVQQGEGVLAALIINTLTSAGQLVACWMMYRRMYGNPENAETQSPSASLRLRVKDSLLPLLRASWHFGLAALFAALQVRLGTILLEQLAGLSAAGFYAGANRFVEAAKLLPNAYFGALFPALAALAADAGGMRRAFRRGAALLGGYGVLAAMGLALLAPLLIDVTYGAAFAAAAPVLVLLAVSLVFTLLRGVRTLYWYAQGREGFVNAVNGAAIVLQIALSLWLIPAYGALGAALVLIGVEAWALAALMWDYKPARSQTVSALG
ncbi:MAG: oligosaccharide flippase family protein [Chloroflexota bacterium]|nr:oligosaccharide flippase family protein [Chloroflexota bacterium]